MMKPQQFLLRLDLQYFSEEKTEKATPQKRKESRDKGQVAKSVEVSSSMLLLSFFLFLIFYGQYLGSSILFLFRDILSTYLLIDLSPDSTHKMFVELSIVSLKLMVPILLLFFVIGLVSNYLQFGFLITTENLKFDLNKLNPVEGAKRIFSMKSVFELIKNILKIFLIAGVSFFLIRSEIETFIYLSHMTIKQMVDYLFSFIIKLGISLSIIYIFIGVIDFIYQQYDNEKKMRMSMKDIKDEHKKTEGDPLIKGKIKEKQREMSFNRMMQEVPKADVVITNPTHYAIALAYDVNAGRAPVVVAKGVDFMAQKIKEVARDNGVITTENKPLARALYKNVEIGQEVPEELFKAVAEILAYVYKLKGKF